MSIKKKSHSHLPVAVLGLVSTLFCNILAAGYSISFQYHLPYLTLRNLYLFIMFCGYSTAIIGIIVAVLDISKGTWKRKGSALGNCGLILCSGTVLFLLIVPLIWGLVYKGS